MPITGFGTFSDGVEAINRVRHDFTVDVDLDNPKLWVPYVENVWFQPCYFNAGSGGFANVLKVLPGSRLPAHYHISWVFGYTLRGSWHYLEHDWVAKPGTFLYEPPGEAHTLVVDADQREPMMTYFVLSGGLIYVDNVKDGKFVAYDDGFTLLEIARKYYRDCGLDQARLDAMIR